MSWGTSAVRVGCSITVALLVTVLVGCGGDDAEPAALPSPTDRAPGSAPEPEPEPESEEPEPTVEELVLAAYQAQWDDFVRAADPPDPDAGHLTDHMTDKALTSSLNELRKFAAEGVGLRGTVETDARVSELGENTARVEDCNVDRTVTYRLDTGDVVQESSGEPRGLVGNMVLEDGAWKIATFARDESICDS